MKTILYGRVSLQEDGQQFGLDSQMRALREYAQAKGYSGIEELTDDGYLGADLQRPSLERVRELARARQVDIVIVHDPDRLSRKLSHLLILQDEFERAGVKLEFITTPPADSPETKLLMQVKGMIGEYEREKIKERTGRGRREKAKQGFIVGGRIAYGYRYLGKAQGERGKLQIDEAKAAIVKKMFEYADDGVSVRAIAKWLNETGVRPIFASKWGRSSVARILRNKTYAGEAHYNRHKRTEPRNPDSSHRSRRNKFTTLIERPADEWISIPVPAIIPAGIFERVADRIRRNKTELAGRPSRQYLLRGLVRCGKCGRRMHGDANHGGPLYRCAGRDSLRPGTPCAARISARRLDTAVWTEVTQLFLKPAQLRAIIAQHRATLNDPDQREKIADVRRQIERLRGREARLLEVMVDSELAAQQDSVRRKLKEAGDERLRLERELTTLTPTENESVLEGVDTMARRIARVVKNLDLDQRQEFLRRSVERVTVAGQDVEVLVSLALPVSMNWEKTQHVVRARRGYLQRALGRALSAHIAKIRRRGFTGEVWLGLRNRRRKFFRARDQCDHFGQVPHAEYAHPVHHRRLSGVLRRHDQVGDSLFARANGHGKSAAHRPDGAIERKLAHQQMVVQARYRAHRAQNAERHRQIEPRALFAHVRRGEIDGDGFVGVPEPGIDQRALDALAALANRRVGHAYSDEIARRARLVHVDFNIDQMSIDAVYGGAERLEQRHAGGSFTSIAKNADAILKCEFPRAGVAELADARDSKSRDLHWS